ncbi:NAD(P)/FAD-dependent oxidoreductase [Salinirubellus sp. GCM10025818]|uniref:NAD(P)/FAD-dependent oxidoreductase n=1 Tax=Salinirubellus TaxID=2162630 RepID=UPI0030D521E8
MSYDVAIVGSGVAGLASAYRLAPDHDVLVVDRDAIGSGTSSRASGVITTPVDYPGQPEWSEHALAFFRELDGTGVFEWTEREFVRGVRPADVEAARESARAEGISLVDRAAYDEVFAEDAPYERALVWEGTGFFDVDEFLATMQRECASRGVEFRPDTAVEAVHVEDGVATGVETEYGSVEADSVVVAAGSGTRPLLADVLGLPLRKFTWNVAYLDADLPEGYPMAGDPVLQCYWRRTRDGHLLVGVQHEYEGPPEDEREVGPEIETLLGEAFPTIAAHGDSEVVRYEVCPMADTTTPDANPIVDAPAEGPANLVIAAGFHGAGVMASDSIGTAVRSLLTGEDAPFPIDPFRLDRFDTRSTDFPFRSLFGKSSRS